MSDCDTDKAAEYPWQRMNIAVFTECKMARPARQPAFTILSFQRYTCAEYVNPYPTAFPYGNGVVLHFYQQQESSMTKTVYKVINKGLKMYV